MAVTGMLDVEHWIAGIKYWDKFRPYLDVVYDELTALRVFKTTCAHGTDQVLPKMSRSRRDGADSWTMRQSLV